MSANDLERFYAFLDHLPIPALVISFTGDQVDNLKQQKIRHVNQKYTDLIGYSIGETPDAASWMALAYPDPGYRQEIMQRWRTEAAEAMAQDEVIAKARVKIRCKDGRERVFDSFSEVRSTIQPDHYIISFIDLTDMASELEGLKQISVMDQLTGAYNQHYLLQRTEQEIERALSTGTGFTLMMADLDFFKTVNDRYGHPCGDYVLVSVAKLFRDVLREADCLARWNGADFVILMREDNPEIARQVIQKAWQAVRAHTFE